MSEEKSSAAEQPITSIYEDFGFSTFDTVTTVPLVIPGTDKGRCLLLNKIEISDKDTDVTFFSESVPFESTVILYSALAQFLRRNLEIMETNNLFVDTQILSRKRILEALADASNNASVLCDLVERAVIDDDRADDTDEQNPLRTD